jgi:hypothetical protein
MPWQWINNTLPGADERSMNRLGIANYGEGAIGHGLVLWVVGDPDYHSSEGLIDMNDWNNLLFPEGDAEVKRIGAAAINATVPIARGVSPQDHYRQQRWQSMRILQRAQREFEPTYRGREAPTYVQYDPSDPLGWAEALRVDDEEPAEPAGARRNPWMGDT